MQTVLLTIGMITQLSALGTLPEHASKACLATDHIANYNIISDQIVMLVTNPDARGNTKQYLYFATPCPQLKFQNYFSFTPTDGLLCADRDTIITRAGEVCTIDAISTKNIAKIASNQ